MHGAYGHTIQVRLLASHGSHVFVVTFAGTLPDKIVKAARDGNEASRQRERRACAP